MSKESEWPGGVSSISGTTLGVSGAFPTSLTVKVLFL